MREARKGSRGSIPPPCPAAGTPGESPLHSNRLRPHDPHFLRQIFDSNLTVHVLFIFCRRIRVLLGSASNVKQVMVKSLNQPVRSPVDPEPAGVSAQATGASWNAETSGRFAVTNSTIMKIQRLLSLVAVLAVTVVAPARAQAESVQDIVGVAVGAGKFNTLVAAVKAAGLVETLKGKGPFTVFAPTDEAFAKLPAGTVESLLKPENKEKLVGILTYHVVPGKVMAADVKTMKAKTVNGKELNLVVAGGKVSVDNASVIKADVAASNGVIHVIDSVVIPK